MTSLLDLAPASPDGALLRGWVDLTCGQAALASKAIRFFEAVLERSPNHLEANLGKARFLVDQSGDLEGAITVLNRVIVAHEEFAPARVEKAKALMGQGQWEAAVEVAEHVLDANTADIDAILIVILHALVVSGNYMQISGRIAKLVQALEKREPKNAGLFYEVARPLARLAGRRDFVLKHTVAMLEKAVVLDGRNSAVLTELGYQRMLVGDIEGAKQAYREAMAVDESNIAALNGIRWVG